MAETLKSFGDGVERVMERTKSIDHHLTHASHSLLDMLKTLGGIHLVQKSLETMMHNSTWGKTLSKVFSVAKMDAIDLHKQHSQLVNDFKDFDASYTARLRLGQTTREQAARERANMREQLNLADAQLRLRLQLQQIGKGELILSGAFLAAATSAYHVFTETSKVLIESNSSLTNRLALTRSILSTQRMLGTDMRESVEAARELVNYGYDLDSSFDSTLKLVLQMKDGLGVSTRLGAELAVVYERQLRTSARGVADAMATLVNGTSVAADEAARLAVNIGRAVSLMKPGANADLSAVTELVGRYEGALKSLGGQFGGFEELLTKMTGPDGLLQAGVLGVRSPEFLRSESATKQVINSFASYAKNFLGNTQGWERALRLQNLSEIFGTTTQQINLMIRAVEDANNTQTTAISIEQRYKDQVFANAQVFGRLKNSLVALAQEAVLPLIGYVTAVLEPIAGVVKEFQKWPGIVATASLVMAGGAIFGARQVYRLSTALYTMATAAHLAAVQVRQRAAGEFIGPVLPGAAGGASFLARTASVIGRIMGAAAGVLIAAAVAYAVYQGIRHYFELDKKYSTVQLSRSSKDFFDTQFLSKVIHKDVPGLQESVITARGRYLKEGLTLADANARIFGQIKNLDKVAEDMRFTKEVTKSLFGPTPEEASEIKALKETQEALVEIAGQQRDNAVQSKQIQEKHLKRVEAEAARQEQDGLLSRGAHNVQNWWNTATEYYSDWMATGNRPTR